MARINIEDSLFKDQRFSKLCIKMQSRRAALGAIIEAWMLAQQYVSSENPSGRVPAAEWQAQEIAQEIIDSGLARIVDEQVEIVGGLKNFAWLVQKKEAARKGGEAKSAKSRQASAPERQAAELEFCPPTLTPTPSLTLSLIPSPAPTLDLFTSDASCEAPAGESKRSAQKKFNDPNSPTRKATWDAYREAYEKRWGVTPDRNAALNAQIKALVEKVGEEAPNIVRFFLGHNDGLYVKSCHPMTLCLRDHVALKTQMLRGQAITTADIRRLEKQQQQHGILRDAEQGGF